MQLYNVFTSTKSAVWQVLNDFKTMLELNAVWRPKDDIQFVFLCGANVDIATPSKRRQSLLKFSERQLPHAKFFLAETIFKILEAEGHKTNFLDIENDLSAFADYVVVVLESESAFCELGAFANHKDLREKLIIINDCKYKESPSFINSGPVKAVAEISAGKQVLYYAMASDGKVHGDAIGDVFSELHNLIHREPQARRTRVANFNPNKHFTKDSLRFIHDLIYFTCPITFTELSRVIKILFEASKEKQLQKYLGLLCATEQISRTSKGLYVSLCDRPFFEYSYDVDNLIASFKNMYFKHDDTRLLCS